MTQSATHFISPLTFQALSGNPVCTTLLDTDAENAMGHINLARWADLFLIAPATANVLAKCSHGLADDLVSTLYLAATCPIVMAPAMNQAMWHKTVTQENVQTLIRHGVTLMGPGQGTQACGEMGFGRMSEASEICDFLVSRLHHQDAPPAELSLHGKKVLISAGPTREALDPVRYITNRSSGKMGYALATAAVHAGAQVVLVSGPVALMPPDTVEMVAVESAEQMYAEIMARVQSFDIYIGAAAIADYTPVITQSEKIKKQATEMVITLKKTRDVLAEVACIAKHPFTVGFAAETHDLEHYAQDKLNRKKIDMIAANWVGKAQGGFESADNELHVFWKNGQKTLAMADKNQIAVQLIQLIAERMNEKSTT
ncbi:fused 4'-phosphopantothenoylcysteine decarboxylase; phosphopantothenoylcysteine synthetase, FMN-binding [Crenothrix polyspora]|uniref:Coenzyme A biosynthesis bifunctional protein CoaBC n=2 Tax=Crenothrix polyspora TaxID=360316 RepID=A0A1R4H3N5_9GAMM|nr:fused 4'-phosphopantothenoylcysteine decarboxylase; phosphopantothenoylcysteine synthetase, FMN-binding [Crenothrix polyspora]